MLSIVKTGYTNHKIATQRSLNLYEWFNFSVELYININ